MNFNDIWKAAKAAKNSLTGRDILPETEKYINIHPSRVLPELPIYNWLEAIKQLNGYAGTFLSYNAQRCARADVVLSVPTKPLPPADSFGYDVEYQDISNPNNVVIDLLNNPNQLTTGHGFKFRLGYKIMAFGNVIIWKNKNNPKRMELIDLDPNQWEVRLQDDPKSFDKMPVKLTALTRQKIGKEFLEVDEYIHLKIDAPYLHHYGVGWLEQAWRSVINDDQVSQTDIARALQRVGIELIVTWPDGTLRPIMEKGQKELENAMMGPHNAGNVMSLMGGKKGPPKIDPVILPTYVPGLPENVVQKLALGLRFPYSKLKGASSGDRMMAQLLRSWENDLSDIPLIIEQGLTKGLLPEFPRLPEGSKIKFNYSPIEDNEETDRKLEADWTNGILDEFEYRTRRGYTAKKEQIGIKYKNPDTIILGAGQTLTQDKGKNGNNIQSNKKDNNNDANEGEENSGTKKD